MVSAVVGGWVAPDVGLVVGLGVNGLPDGLGVKGLLVSLGDVGVVVASWANAPDDSPKTIPAASVAKILVMEVFLVSAGKGKLRNGFRSSYRNPELRFRSSVTPRPM
jgi:hypothetical protein